jgi:spore coat protein U-like protein
MKKLLAIITAVGLTAMAGTAMAATANLNVTANITAACSVTGGTLKFGELLPLGATDVMAYSQDVSVTCTKGADYTVELNYGENAGGGSQAYLNNTGNSDKIAYSVSVSDPGTGTGTGTAQDITIKGDIVASAYTGASAGTYTDTIQITVTP